GQDLLRGYLPRQRSGESLRLVTGDARRLLRGQPDQPAGVAPHPGQPGQQRPPWDRAAPRHPVDGERARAGQLGRDAVDDHRHGGRGRAAPRGGSRLPRGGTGGAKLPAVPGRLLPDDEQVDVRAAARVCAAGGPVGGGVRRRLGSGWPAAAEQRRVPALAVL
ncbi:MAG: hypothetical protein AVDCRST_MAG77-4860, partial [uncultured Chloroflexi bacterium]